MTLPFSRLTQEVLSMTGSTRLLTGCSTSGILGRRFVNPVFNSLVCSTKLFQVQTMDFFDRRQQLKQEFSDYYEKSLTKKYQPETPAQ